MGRFSYAEQELRETLDRNPDDIASRCYLILAYLRQGKSGEAKRELANAVSVRKNFHEAFLIFSGICQKEKRLKEGIEMCTLTIEEKGETPFLLIEMGKLYSAKGANRKAEESFKRALKLDEDYIPAYLSLGLLFQGRGDHAGAISMYGKALRTDPQSLRASILLANSYMKIADTGEAMAVYEESLKLHPDCPEILNNLAYLYIEREGRMDEALDLSLRARELDPGNPAILDTLGWIYYKNGNYKKGVALLERSDRIRPSNPDTLYHLGMAYYRAGNMESAQDALKKALKIGPHSGWSMEARKVLTGIKGE